MLNQFNVGDAVTASLPLIIGDMRPDSVIMYVVAPAKTLVTCAYFADGNKPVSVVLPAVWLSKVEPPQSEVLLPMASF